MYVDFESLPENSRIWVYQANRSLTDEETSEIEQKTKEFLTKWTAHGAHLEASFELKYKRFLIIAINQDTQAATGCSIDASVAFVQQLEKDYEIDLLDKMNVSFKQGEFIAYKALTDFKKMAKNKSVSKNTIVFNNLVTNKYEYENFWEVPASESWHSRFLN
ncbi:hypothetical protein SAMN05216480_111100 [Pustulibacterium marinum]|uniref:ABC transporter ATPase n=1 Tax=Pustulibacterium marinum TaxID=1224947 RepID=A0A1I7HXF3_9FLAO|nr:ABC transporter ATPase [Pustulibacterium marinum]SFU65166.1 hypothetical protein SAMN05216480_111100 [Pustulibacterium marinum]